MSYLDLPKESTGINWQSLKWCKILNRSVSVIGLYVISFESAGLKLSRYKYLTRLFSWFENSKGACIKVVRDDFI